jgi:hypothetical protein
MRLGFAASWFQLTNLARARTLQEIDTLGNRTILSTGHTKKLTGLQF